MSRAKPSPQLVRSTPGKCSPELRRPRAISFDLVSEDVEFDRVYPTRATFQFLKCVSESSALIRLVIPYGPRHPLGPVYFYRSYCFCTYSCPVDPVVSVDLVVSVDRSASVNPPAFVDLHCSVDLTVSRGPYVLIDHTPALTPVMARRHYRASRSVTGMLKTHVIVHFAYPVSSMCYPVVVPGIPDVEFDRLLSSVHRSDLHFSGVYPTRATFRFLKCVSESMFL
ncbi:hypothetical protein GQ457_16G007670 [Hibiscus cannabinus]